jgi:glucuronokinase
MDASFDVRRSIAALDPRHVRMVELARSLGAAANYAGSGGAIVGLLGDAADLDRLAPAFQAEECAIAVCRPAARPDSPGPTQKLNIVPVPRR